MATVEPFLFSIDMDLSQIKKSEILDIELLAKQVVEGFVTGMHKSPFHGFSVEFSEHKLYNKGESTKHVDWKLFAKTEKLYTKKYEEETNLRCHIIIDNSASMHYPIQKSININNLNKISFSVVASACLIELLKKQRDAVGLSVYSDVYEFYSPEKGNERHRKRLFSKLESILKEDSKNTTDTYKYLHEIAEKLHRRSLIFLFTDMFQTTAKEEELFQALRHLKYNKHDLILFHTFDKEKEFTFDFDNTPKKFFDVETGDEISSQVENLQEKYRNLVSDYFKKLKYKCLQYQIDYVPVDINKSLSSVLESYLLKRKKIK